MIPPLFRVLFTRTSTTLGLLCFRVPDADGGGGVGEINSTLSLSLSLSLRFTGTERARSELGRLLTALIPAKAEYIADFESL